MRKLLGLILFSLLPLAAVASQYSLDVHTIVGFSGVFRAGTWTPIHVTVQNLGEPVRGTLEIEVERGDRYGSRRNLMRYSREVELVSEAGKAYSFVVPLQSMIYPLTIRIRDGRTIAHEEKIALLGRSVSGYFTLVLARRPNLDFLLPVYNTRDERVLDIVYPLPTYLPNEWHGYEAVDTIVIHDARIQELSDDQVRALRDWVANGGRLVLSGGAHFGPADAETLAPLGDFSTTGVAVTSIASTGLAEAGIAIDPAERDREVVATSFREHGTQVARLTIGRGEVVLLPADYANLVRVAPLTSVALWNSLLAPEASRRAVATEAERRVFETDFLANQLALPLYDFPSRLLVLGLAISFIVGLGAILLWLATGRDRVRTLLGAPALLGIIAAVAVTGHLSLTVKMQPEEALALTIERAELTAGGGYAAVTRDTALFSRRVSDYKISYENEPLLVPMQRRDHMIHQKPDRIGQEITVDRWSYANTVAFEVAELNVRAELQTGPGYAGVVVTNDSALHIHDLVLLRNGIPEPMGDLPPSGVVEHVATSVLGRDFQDVNWNRYVADDELAVNRARFLEDLARAQRFGEGEPAELIVVGWTRTPLLPVSIEPSFERTIDLHVMIIPLNPNRGEA